VEGEEGNETKAVQITSHLDEPLALEMQQSDISPFRAELEEKTPGKEFALRVTYVGPATSTVQSRTIEMKSSAREMPLIKVSVFATPQRAVGLLPAAIQVPSPQREGKFQHTQMVVNNSSEPMKVIAAAVDVEGVTTEITELRPDKLFSLTLNFPEGYEPQPGHQLSIRTTHPKHRELTVPITIRLTSPNMAQPIQATGSK